MTRIPELKREALPEALREAFDEVVAISKPQGPGAIAIHSPELARRRIPLNGYLRWNMAVDQRIHELTILTTARSLGCAYVWNAHAGEARKAGVSDALVDAIRDKQALPDAPADETAIVRYVMALFVEHKVSDAIYQTAVDAFGVKDLVELTALAGLYATNAFLVNAFDFDLPAGTTEPRLPV
ncbi:MAG: carboxymuconolactone decarboxylase family protein [Chloroflexi bacterium]|nr:carboxymuconolactone decarboxylase family protein [Chloroflexota bacterium]